MAYYIDDGMSDVCSVVSGLMAAVKIKLLMTILVPWSAAGLGAWRRGGGPRTGWDRGMLLAAMLLLVTIPVAMAGARREIIPP